jgi:hypothetical protein
MCPQIWTLADFALTLRNPTWAWRADKFDHPEKPATSWMPFVFAVDLQSGGVNDHEAPWLHRLAQDVPG